MILRNLHILYIQNTPFEGIVEIAEKQLCSLTLEVSKVISKNEEISEKQKVICTTLALKHLYDKKPAEEYDFALNHAHEIVKYPDKVYANKDAKRGGFAFVKSFGTDIWFCSLEYKDGRYYLVTCFRIRKESYLNGYNLIWSWKGDIPSS